MHSNYSRNRACVDHDLTLVENITTKLGTLRERRSPQVETIRSRDSTTLLGHEALERAKSHQEAVRRRNGHLPVDICVAEHAKDS